MCGGELETFRGDGEICKVPQSMGFLKDPNISMTVFFFFLVCF